MGLDGRFVHFETKILYKVAWACSIFHLHIPIIGPIHHLSILSFNYPGVPLTTIDLSGSGNPVWHAWVTAKMTNDKPQEPYRVMNLRAT